MSLISSHMKTEYSHTTRDITDIIKRHVTQQTVVEFGDDMDASLVIEGQMNEH